MSDQTNEAHTDASGNKRDWDAIAKEYDKVQGEISENYKMALTVCTGGITGTLTAVGWFAAVPTVPAVVYLAPLALAIPAILAVHYSHCANMRLGAYVLMFLEPETTLKYETRNFRRSTLKRGVPGSRREPSYPVVVSTFLASLVLFDLILFGSRLGRLLETEPSLTAFSLFLAAVGSGVIIWEFGLIRQNRCWGYRNEWREVRGMGPWNPDAEEKEPEKQAHCWWCGRP